VRKTHRNRLSYLTDFKDRATGDSDVRKISVSGTRGIADRGDDIEVRREEPRRLGQHPRVVVGQKSLSADVRRRSLLGASG
jgi:hypothetical protein